MRPKVLLPLSVLQGDRITEMVRMDLLSSEAVRCYGWEQEWGKPRDKTGSRNSISERESWENEASIRGNNDRAYEVITDDWGRQPWAYIHVARWNLFGCRSLKGSVCEQKHKRKGAKCQQGRTLACTEGCFSFKRNLRALPGIKQTWYCRLVQALHLILKVGTTCHK